MKNLVATLKTLADESRLRIYGILLTSGELCVCDIEATLHFSQTKVSRHLAYLKRAGLVKDRRMGLWMLYSLTEPKSEAQKHLLEAIAEALKANPVAQRDAKLLAQKIKRGSCTAYSVFKPVNLPAALELN